MQDAAHASTQSVIHRLVLFYARHSAKAFADDACGIMVAVARKVSDLDERIGKRGLNHFLNFVRVHGHYAGSIN